MGERLPYKQRVTGSSPVSSIEPLAQLVEQLTFNQWVDSSSLSRLIFNPPFAGVAELADALDLGSSIERCAGSIPVRCTKKSRLKCLLLHLYVFFTALKLHKQHRACLHHFRDLP